MKKIYTLVLLFLAVISQAFAGDAAPSCHLYYSGGNANSDIWMNSVNIPVSTTYTYYSVMGWNTGAEGGGYCGIQDHPDGKNFIFSIWDPSNHLPIVGAYAGPGTKIENFGGEGTGLKSWNFSLGWNTGTWYTLVTRVWQANGHTFFGFWSQDQTTSVWTHIVTMDYPVANVTFTGGNDAFIEDWIGSGVNTRKVLFKDMWQRSTAGSWKLLKAASFSSNSGDAVRNGIYDQAFNAGIETGAFFMQTGGSTTHSFSGRSTSLSISSTATKPTTTIGELSSFITSYNSSSKTANFSWEVNSLKSPQFSYTYEVFNNANFTGSPLVTKTAILPQQRVSSANLSSLANGTYYVRFTIKDIFDNVSVAKTASLNVGSSPVVTITSPANNATVGLGVTTLINANVTGNSISKVEFYVNQVKIGEDLIAPYSITNTFTEKGTFVITAVAYDAAQNLGTANINIIVDFLCSKLTGTASGSSPAYNNGTSTFDKVFDGDTTTFFDYSQANNGYAALDLGVAKIINGITFFPRSGNEGRMTGGKFQASNSSNFSTGVVDLYVISTSPAATWNDVVISNTASFRYVRYLSPAGGYCNIAEVKFCGTSINVLPTVSVTSPVNNAPFNAPATITINATATDADGSISAVSFYNGTTLLGSDVSNPYSYTWTGVTAGTYAITAVATDNMGGVKTSSIVNVTVSPTTDIVNQELASNTVAYPNPTTGFINFSNPVSGVIISDLAGRIVLEVQSSEITTVDLTGIVSGVYVLQYENISGRFFQKILKN